MAKRPAGATSETKESWRPGTIGKYNQKPHSRRCHAAETVEKHGPGTPRERMLETLRHVRQSMLPDNNLLATMSLLLQCYMVPNMCFIHIPEPCCPTVSDVRQLWFSQTHHSKNLVREPMPTLGADKHVFNPVRTRNSKNKPTQKTRKCARARRSQPKNFLLHHRDQ